MFYFEIAIASKNYRGKEFLIYSSEDNLEVGQVITAKFRKNEIRGFVMAKTTEPDFKTTDIDNVEQGFILPKGSVNLCIQLINYYPFYPGAMAALFLPSYSKSTDAGRINNQKNYSKLKISPELNASQKKIYESISNKTNQSSFIIHGDTGTGKTRIYQELVLDCLKNNKSVVILTPEISLTPPIFGSFQSIFKESVVMIHSGMTNKKRAEIWFSIMLSDNPQIIIGPRSTLFMPINNLGLIIIDEFHDSSYKQVSAPFYHAIRAASILAMNTKTKLILGSATPSISDYYFAEQKNVPILRIVDQAVTNKPKVLSKILVDLSDNNERSSYNLISKALIEQISKQLAAKKQSLIFINRRGSSRSIVCQYCGWRATCKNCELPLIYHNDLHKFICHTCGHRENSFAQCPSCTSISIDFRSPGTKYVAESLQKIFPGAKIARFDKDNKKSEKLENNYQKVTSGEIDIIVGTQILTKGHDLPKLGLVAVIQADMSLDFPDFSTEERTFQLINQLAGRVGRGHTEGILLVQTFNVSNNLLRNAVDSKWQEFYLEQLNVRKKFGFPPFYHAMKIEASRKSRLSAEKSLQKLVNQHTKLSFKILGPSPSFAEKQNQNFVWQLIIMSKKRSDLLELAENIQSNYKIDIDPINFL